MRMPFEPVARSLAIDIHYKNNDSSSGVVTFDGDYVYSEKTFEGESVLLRILQKAMAIPNRVDYSYSTEGGQGELHIDRKTIYMSHLIRSKEQDVLSSIQTKLIVLSVFESDTSKELIELLEGAIETIHEAKEQLSEADFELFLDQVDDKIESLFDDESPIDESPVDSGVATALVTPDRIDSPTIQQLNLPPMDQIVARVTSSLKNVTIFEHITYSEERPSSLN